MKGGLIIVLLAGIALNAIWLLDGRMTWLDVLSGFAIGACTFAIINILMTRST